MDATRLSIAQLCRAYREGRLTPSGVTEQYLEKLEPGPVYRIVTAERAFRQALAAEKLFRGGVDIGPLQGVPIALKDLIDTEGEVSAAGSNVLAENPPAREDAPAAARLDAAGAVFLGKTAMTELAYSGLGLNPHFGTPGNALDAKHVPGGSSSGAAVAVAKGLACAAVGSDTGGSVRIPASFNGLVGLKTTDKAIPTDGCTPLSTTLDTLGPITRTVEDAWILWQALCAKPYKPFQPLGGKLKLLVPTTIVLDETDPEVLSAFEGACARLERTGHSLERLPVPEFAVILDLYRRYGTFASHESFALYGALLSARGDEMDPRVTRRVLEYRDRPASDYLRLCYARARLLPAFWETYRHYHALVLPSVPILPPEIAALEEDTAYFEANRLVLRNTLLFNFLSGPAVSVPCGSTRAGLSVGLMVATAPQQEELALQIAARLEAEDQR